MSKNVEILQSARKKKGLSQEALAAKIGISHRMLQRYEDGKFPKYKSNVVKKIDEVLGTSLYELIYESKTKDSEHGNPIDRTDHLIQTLERTNKTLETIILANLTGVNTNLTVLTEVIKTNQLMIDSIQVRQSAQHTVMLGSLDRIEGRKEGALLVKASKLENDLRQEAQARSRQTAADSKSM